MCSCATRHSTKENEHIDELKSDKGKAKRNARPCDKADSLFFNALMIINPFIPGYPFAQAYPPLPSPPRMKSCSGFDAADSSVVLGLSSVLAPYISEPILTIYARQDLGDLRCKGFVRMIGCSSKDLWGGIFRKWPDIHCAIPRSGIVLQIED